MGPDAWHANPYRFAWTYLKGWRRRRKLDRAA